VLALLRRESGLRWPDTRCDAVVGRWTLGSGVLRTPSTSLIPTGFSRGQAIRVGLTLYPSRTRLTSRECLGLTAPRVPCGDLRPWRVVDPWLTSSGKLRSERPYKGDAAHGVAETERGRCDARI
jgi:hypothetical protein